MCVLPKAPCDTKRGGDRSKSSGDVNRGKNQSKSGRDAKGRGFRSKSARDAKRKGALPKAPRNVKCRISEAVRTINAGLYSVACTVREFGVAEALDAMLGVKKRNRGPSDVETALSMVYSKISGNGSLSDLDAQRKDEAVRALTGIDKMPGSRGAGRWLHHCENRHVDQLREVNRQFARKVLPAVVDHEVKRCGYVGIFIDASIHEVGGSKFEGAARGYGDVPRYLSHCAFVGPLWVDGILNEGDAGITRGWEELLVNAVSPLPEGTPAWVHGDNAYYKGDFANRCDQLGVDFSLSVTNATYCKPLHRLAEEVPEDAWQRIGRREEAAVIRHWPSGSWQREQFYVAIRRWELDGRQRRLLPSGHSFILVSRDDLPVRELVRRHRAKQAQENNFKWLREMDADRPPCSKFQANRAFHALSQLAQMLLVATQYHKLPVSARKHGLRTLIRHFVRVPGQLFRHGRGLILEFTENIFRVDWIRHVYLNPG